MCTEQFPHQNQGSHEPSWHWLDLAFKGTPVFGCWKLLMFQMLPCCNPGHETAVLHLTYQRQLFVQAAPSRVIFAVCKDFYSLAGLFCFLTLCMWEINAMCGGVDQSGVATWHVFPCRQGYCKCNGNVTCNGKCNGNGNGNALPDKPMYVLIQFIQQTFA